MRAKHRLLGRVGASAVRQPQHATGHPAAWPGYPEQFPPVAHRVFEIRRVPSEPMSRLDDRYRAAVSLGCRNGRTFDKYALSGGFREPVLAHHHVNALFAIDNLRDPQVASEAEKHIGLILVDTRAR